MHQKMPSETCADAGLPSARRRAGFDPWWDSWRKCQGWPPPLHWKGIEILAVMFRSGGRSLKFWDQQLGDLHGVERGAFEELVADDPESETVVERAVQAQAADGAVVAAGDV